MLICQSKAQNLNELLCLIVDGRDGRTVNADHQQQQGRHIYILYAPLTPCAFGLAVGHVQGHGP